MNPPKISVLIPAYNAAGSIATAIQSVPMTDDVEMIVYNDGSTDDTAERVRNLTTRVTVIDAKENRGVAYAVNRLLEAATGEWVVLLGSDDWFIPANFDKIRKELYNVGPSADLIYFNLEINSGEIWRVIDDASKYNCCGSVKFMRREFVGATRCREDLKTGEDWYFFVDLQAKKPREIFTDIVVKHYNFPRTGSLSDLRRRKVI